MNEHKRDQLIQAQSLYIKIVKGEDLSGFETEKQVEMIKGMLKENPSDAEESKE